MLMEMESGKVHLIYPGTFEYIYYTDGWVGTESPGLIAEMINGETCVQLLIILVMRID